VIAAKDDYAGLVELLQTQNGETAVEQRKAYAAKAFEMVMNYDIAINNYFNGTILKPLSHKQAMRYGENPHQKASFYGDLPEVFTQLHGKELSYNNLVDVDAAIQLINEFTAAPEGGGLEGAPTFAIIKHTNVCGVASRATVKDSWDTALAGDNESAFGGVLVCNSLIDKATAEAISEIFFEVLIAPAFDQGALTILKSKKNRILLELKSQKSKIKSQFKSVLNGTLVQDSDEGNYAEWKEVGGRETSATEKDDLIFANIICKHLKSNAIAFVKNKQLVGKGCGQTSRIDSLRQSIDKAKQFNFDLHGAVLASDAFFPFNDCVQMAHAEGIEAFIQPGGSVRDKDSIEYCVQNKLAMVMTGMRHFKH
jgi:phosphoribosylaminoimidazolecarboxamide formyltransferase/IMP cyclohydrolase